MPRAARISRGLRRGWHLLPTEDYRLRSEAALTHPVTLLSLAVLLVNDHLLKSVWPGSWVTGKLSDLAWLIFAVPLLAWLLSFIARGSLWQRWAFLAAYAGLPALYLVFNIFEPVHDAILTAITTPFGLTPGSPQDATDSIVIPLALVITLLVWRASSADKALARRKWVVLVTAATALASVATSVAEPKEGITNVISTEEGAIIASGYQSDDGGWTWTPSEQRMRYSDQDGQRVETPRGTYEINRADIVRIAPDGDGQVVYSADYLAAGSNRWIQWLDTERFGYRLLVTEPQSIAYDQRTGNLIVGLGLQGVAVGTPDGEWTRVAVNDFRPTDLSFEAKFPILVATPGYWAASLALALSLISVAQLYSRRETTELALGPAMFGVSLFVLTFFAPILFFFSIITVPTLLILAAVAAAKPPESEFRAVILALLAASAVSAALWALTLFSSLEPDNWVDDFLLYSVLVGAYLFGFALFMASWQSIPQFFRTVPFFALMNALIFLSFMIWLRLGINTFAAALLAAALSGSAAFVLFNYLRSKLPPLSFVPSSSATKPGEDSDLRD